MSNTNLKVLVYFKQAEPRIASEAAIELFKDKYETHVFDKSQPFAEQFKEADVVLDIGGWASREMIDAATACRFWQIVGVGLDHSHVDYLQSKGVVVANCPGHTSCQGLAECAMMFILMLSRRFNEVKEKLMVEQKLYEPAGVTLSGLTLGLVGFGASGQALARRARAFGMKIMAVEKFPVEASILEELKPEFMGTPDELDDVVKKSDFLSLHVPLIEETHHLIDSRRLSLMKPTACLINVARGALVDEGSLYRYLLEGKLGGAGIDVFSQEPPDVSHDVFKLPNMIVTPHISGNTDHTWRERAKIALENVDRITQGLDPHHRVETPNQNVTMTSVTTDGTVSK